MTPKHRVRTAIEHREPDIVPVGEWIIDFEPASLVLGRPTFLRGKALLAHALWQGRRDEIVASTKRDIVELVRRLDLDLVSADLTYHAAVRYDPPEQVNEETWRDRRGNVFRYSALTRDLMLLEEGEATYEPDQPSDWVDGEFRPHPSRLEIIDHVLAELGQSHFLFTTMGGGTLPIYSALSVERDLLRLADEDPDQLGEQKLRAIEGRVERMPFFARLGFDAVLDGEDYGFNSGPFMSPDTFRRVHLPALKRLCDAAHQHGLFFIQHSCSNLRLLLPLMIEAGVDVYQAIQPIEDIAGLKRDFGRHLCLWGGVSNHDLVLAGPDEIRRQVKESIAACSPGGGFLLGSSHSITVQTPLANIVAMFEAAGRRPQVALAPAPG